MKKPFLLLFVICFFFGCSSVDERQAPDVLLTEPQLVDVMTDVYIMEGIISYKKNVNQKTAIYRTEGYDTLFSHYGITDSLFKENLRYYNDVDPQLLIRVMDSVEARLLLLKN